MEGSGWSTCTSTGRFTLAKIKKKFNLWTPNEMDIGHSMKLSPCQLSIIYTF